MIKQGLSLVVTAVAAMGSQAHASYIVTPRVNGSNAAIVAPGQSFNVDIVLNSNANDVHNSAIVRVVFSAPGLMYESYAWSAPYQTGSIFDDSHPGLGALPALLTARLLSGPGYPSGVVDIELSNVVPSGVFGAGMLASLSLSVPLNYAGPSQISISAAPDTIANGFNVIAAQGGEALVVQVVPAPSVLSIALASLCLHSRRRAQRDGGAEA